MRSSSTVALLSAALLPSAALGASTPFLDVCLVESVLEYFSCLKPVPEGCVESVEEQVIAFCNSYLSIEPVTTYLSTVTPDGEVETVTKYTTVESTSTDVVLTTVETTATTIETSIVRETITATITAGPAPPVKRAPTLSAVPNCPDLTKKNLAGKPAWKLSKACSCLDPQPTTVTLDATTISAGETVTVTEPATSTIVIPETTTSTESSTTVVTEATTVTETSTATATVQPAVPNRCSVGYNASGNGQGNRVVSVRAEAGGPSCCEICGTTPNCVAIAGTGLSCQLLVKQTQLAGAPTNELCPLGIETYNFGAPVASGAVFKGPCAA
ncbi:hypothetical protein QBC35DRAFT_196525 [Podospora australis]|uniref:Apple domain-containing protein n=1 Tax=Podospora australis TaxID=1536484 RepID=A0AAN6WIA1_9PEZI|nr:hypothetical protein QBC35DRAFT_196525 [Podospora australis]